MELIQELRPEQCTFVPDQDHQLTSDHGWDLSNNNNDLEVCINKVHELNIRVSLFMDPNEQQIKEAKNLGADRVELYTGPYAEAFFDEDSRRKYLQRYSEASQYSKSIGLGVNAGHDLDQVNLKDFLLKVDVDEVSIGQALISDALEEGLEGTVRNYLEICQ
tara:strand:- start:14 stop:499 length:486 start_codon:yes stop_codon:yes gene_type:complete